MSCRVLSFIFHFKHMCLHQQLHIKCGFTYSFIQKYFWGCSMQALCPEQWAQGRTWRRPSLKESEVPAGCDRVSGAPLIGQCAFPNVASRAWHWPPWSHWCRVQKNYYFMIWTLNYQELLITSVFLEYIILRKCTGRTNVERERRAFVKIFVRLLFVIKTRYV